MDVNVFNWSLLHKYYPKFSLSEESFKNILEKYLGSYTEDNVNFIFVSKAYIEGLNSQYRSKNYPTDVLSFEIKSNDILGEVYICPEYISENYPEEEIFRTAVHGFLHLLGYDHTENFLGKGKNIEEIFVMQENILQNILHEINNRTGEPREEI